MLQLGSFDLDVPVAARDAYVKRLESLTRVRLADVAASSDKLAFQAAAPDAAQPMTVADVQRGLQSLGFFPGGEIDGICGYRTLSAMRLFQEYVRSVERQASVPDGRFGAGSQQHLKRWMSGGVVSAWTPAMQSWAAGTLAGTEYTQWLALLEKVKAQYLATPTRTLQLVNAFAGRTDTRKVSAWDFAPAGNVHLIGVRRSEKSGKFDDIFVLLLKGLVFKFQGSTEPGASSNAAGVPFLVHGQHDYHFGWHRQQYLALRPQHLDAGVLVVRSRNDLKLDDRDLDSGLEANGSINIHWGGKGMKFDVKSWSEGCQVINGSMYLDTDDAIVDCSSFAATNNGEISANRSKTRGAYNVLLDLVTALGGDLPGGAVKYSLLREEDLALDAVLAKGLEQARDRARALLG